MAQVNAPPRSSLATVRRPARPGSAARTIARAQSVRPGLRVAEGRSAGVSLVEDLAIVLLTAAPAAGVGVWTALALGLHHYDALARTYDAVQVFFGYEPKLANIGFIWAPLPTLLLFPLVALLPGLAYEGGVAPVISGLAAGVCMALLNRILALYVPRWRFRALFLLLFGVNPMIMMVAISGLSELILLALVLLAWLAFQRLTFEEPLPFVQVGVMGGAIAGAVLTRYEGLMFAVALGAMFVAVMYLQKRPEQWPFTEGLAVAFVTPWAYAFAVWMFFNAMIMGNPLHFMVGKGSAHEHAAVLLATEPLLAGLAGNIAGSVLQAARAAWDVSPVFAAVTPVALLAAVARRDLFLLSMLAAALSFPAMQSLLYWRGESLGWLRYHMYVIPFGAMMLAYLLRSTLFVPRGTASEAIMTVVLLALTVGSNVMTWHNLEDARFVPGHETNYLRVAFLGRAGGANWYPVRGTETGRYLREQFFPAEPDALVLIDDQQADDIILMSGHPDRFVVPSADVFFEYLRDPVGRVTHFLVPQTAAIGSDYILATYPRLYDEGAPFAALEQELNADGKLWRLYRIAALSLGQQTAAQTTALPPNMAELPARPVRNGE